MRGRAAPHATMPAGREQTGAPRARRRRRAGVLLLDVAAGGALGASARYGIGLALPAGAAGFPWATFIVNASGSGALSLLVVLVVERLEPGRRLSRHLRPLAAVGFLGAYTTYSTYAVEVDTLARDGHGGLAGLYALASLLVGLLAACAGPMAGRLLERGIRPAAAPLEERVAEAAEP